MKRLFLAVSVASALGLVGCSGEDSVDELKDKTEALIPQSHLIFDPTAGNVPLPSDLLYSGTRDGTINIPGEDASDYTNPQFALGALDGWSTTQPISIDFAPATDHNGNVLSLNAASVFQAGAVRLFEATVGGPLSADPDCQSAAPASACKIGAELQFGVDFVSQAMDNKIVIVPLKPLKAGQSYLYATSSLIEDSENRAVAASTTYATVKMDINTSPLGTEAQRGLQLLVNSYENALATMGVDKDSLTYSSLFTTQSVNPVYESLKLLMASNDAFRPAFEMLPTATGLTVAQALGLSPQVGAAYTMAELADVYVARIKLPIYGDCSSMGCLSADQQPNINGHWKALGDSPVSVLLALQSGALSQQHFAAQALAQGISDPAAALANPALLVGKQFMLDDGSSVDPSRHLTKFNPVPALKGYESVPVVLAIPNAAKLKQFVESQGQTFVAPTNGWPVNIAMHGLGGGKEIALAYAGAYAAAGIATIAIDMPLHGERSFDADKDGVYEVSATDPEFGPAFGKGDVFIKGSPLVFVNIASTLSVRDNFRQAVVDHLGLRLLLTGLAQAQAAASQPQLFDVSKVSSQGLSLGAIVNTDFATYAATGLVDPVTGSGLPNPYQISAASLVSPSGGMAGAFVGSATFGPVLFNNLTASADFQALVAQANSEGLQPGSPEYAALVEQVYQGFVPRVAFALQTAVDAMDPVNHAAMLKETGLPVHVIAVVGDGNANLPDQVLPNTVEGFPLSGAEPLIATLGLECRDSSQAGSGAVRFSKGHHSSLFDPRDNSATDGMAAAATAEMQWQVSAFAKTAAAGSASILIRDASVLQPCP